MFYIILPNCGHPVFFIDVSTEKDKKNVNKNDVFTTQDRYLKEVPVPETIGHDRLLRIPRRQSNYEILTSSMEVKQGDIPSWISCPPAVIIK